MENKNKKPVVLVVDDAPENIDLMNTILQSDYRIKVANSGKRGLEIARSDDPPDLILLDVMMPEMSGFDVCRELKRALSTKNIPVIFITAKGDVKDESTGFECGGVDYITKPVTSPIVRARVRTHLALADQNKALENRTTELRTVNQALARASRLKDEFLSSMSHELRTPLTAILNLSEALQEEVYGPVTEKQLKSLHTIEDSGRHLLGLINDILDLSKIEAGQLKLQLDEFLLEGVCQNSIQLIGELARAKHQIITFACEPESIPIRADARRVKQMLVNLLGNAIKFTPDGGLIGLSVRADEIEQVVRLIVWDSGIGISPEDMKKLFQPFVQLDSGLSRQQSGTGLGLALVRSMANLHGGSVSVESTPGQGSRFITTLPWNKASTASVPMKARNTGLLRHRHGNIPLPEGQPPLILVADDNEINRQTYSDYLEARGFQVIKASDGKEAARLASQMRPDLILMDIQMPGMDGLQATGYIRKHPDPEVAAIPIIAFTALTMPGDRERCLAAGVNDYLSKPVSLSVLIKTIETWLSNDQKGD